MVASKSLKIMSGMILNQLQPKFAAKSESVTNEMLCLKPCSDQHGQDKLQFEVFGTLPV